MRQQAVIFFNLLLLEDKIDIFQVCSTFSGGKNEISK